MTAPRPAMRIRKAEASSANRSHYLSKGKADELSAATLIGEVEVDSEETAIKGPGRAAAGWKCDPMTRELEALELLVAELLVKNQQLRFALNDARELIRCLGGELTSVLQVQF